MINIKEFLGLLYYTSPLDNFLALFDKEHPRLSASQRKEIEKNARIAKLRDDPKYVEHKDSFWEKF